MTIKFLELFLIVGFYFYYKSLVRRRNEPEIGIKLSSAHDNKTKFILSVFTGDRIYFFDIWIITVAFLLGPMSFFFSSFAYAFFAMVIDFVFLLVYIPSIIFLEYNPSTPTQSYYSRAKEKIREISFARPPQLIPQRVTVRSVPGGGI